MTASSTQTFRDTHLLDAAAAAQAQTKDIATVAAQTDLWIFRDGCRQVPGPAFVRDLACRISQKTSVSDALIQAGELEAALADAGSADADAAAELTDAFAYRVCTGNASESDPADIVGRITVPDLINISPPEGFTYYALHPLDFAKLVARIPGEPRSCAIIGIRSIGTTLSAMVAAQLWASGRAASRITVRPTGHPYARTIQFTAEQASWIDSHKSRSAQFLIVDEGPGRSGSTFLSVAEALLRAGVPPDAITIMGSRRFDPDSLCAESAAARWREFRFLSTMPSVNTRFENCLYIGGGDWRNYLCNDGQSNDGQNWPESWTQMERLKFLSPDRQRFFKFEGMGPIGAEVQGRAFILADAGFCPQVSDAEDGFLAYDVPSGRHMRPEDLSTSVLERIANYCAFRASQFRCQQAEPTELQKMLEFNVLQEFGRELSLRADGLLSSNSVLSDGRMQPHEWIVTRSGDYIKTDAISHGDNHFFPGPCDIAWDLAGTAIEWRLGSDALKFLLTRFGQISGRDLSRQLPLYLLAYSVFRLGFCKMAMSTVRGSPEEQRLQSGYFYYRNRGEQMLKEFSN